MTISDLLTPRNEITEGRFQGVLQAHKVGSDEDRLENDSDRLLSMTYPSNALQTAFNRVDDKLEGRDSQGGITLSGPYGAGKSHGLLTLYHLFNSPEAGQAWLDEWGVDISVPNSARASILSTSQTDADRIWEPIFRDLGGEDILDEVNRYPTTDHIEDLVGDEPVAVFFDEIETWWEAFRQSGDSDLLEANEFFLQNLFEVASDPQRDLFVFVTLLDKSQDFKRILERTSPYSVDLNDTGDRERIILHRLFETRREDIDESAVREIVSEYIEGYTDPIQTDELGEIQRYEDRMVETYPFHPELLRLLDNLYEAGKERQNVRGAMNVLADTVRRLYEDTDLIITCDVEPSAFRGINATLFNRYVSDRDHVEEVDHGDDLLRTILLYTLDERAQMASVTESLVGTYKPSKTTIDKLDMSLNRLYGTAHYLDRNSGNDHYYITEDPKLTALVTREQSRLLEDERNDIEDTLVNVVREDVWGDDVYVYPDDDIPDTDSLSIVVTLEYLSNGALESELTKLYSGRKYQNQLLFVTPKKAIRDDNEVFRKAARVLGAENLRGKVDDDKGELRRIIRDERRELVSELSGRFGKWVKWSTTSDGELRMRRKNVIADVADVKDKVGRDKTYVGETILETVEGTESGVTVESMLNDFKQFRRMPVLLDDELFYSALRKLYEENKIVLQGDRANLYVPHKGDRLPDLEDDLTIRYPDSLPTEVFEEDEEPEGGEGGSGTNGSSADVGAEGDSEGQTSLGGGGSTTEPGSPGPSTGGGGTSVVSSTTEEQVTLEGNSARVLRSMAESRVNGDTDTVTSIELTYDVDDMSKEDLLEFLGELPSASHIDATLVIESEAEE